MHIIISCFIDLFLEEKNNILYVELAHGGHLGFYEGGLLYPNPVTWLDKALVALVGSLVLYDNDSILKSNTKNDEGLAKSSNRNNLINHF